MTAVMRRAEERFAASTMISNSIKLSLLVNTIMLSKDTYSPLRPCPEFRRFGWGARIRTWECRNQNPVPYRLATPQKHVLYIKTGAPGLLGAFSLRNPASLESQSSAPASLVRRGKGPPDLCLFPAHPAPRPFGASALSALSKFVPDKFVLRTSLCFARAGQRRYAPLSALAPGERVEPGSLSASCLPRH